MKILYYILFLVSFGGAGYTTYLDNGIGGTVLVALLCAASIYFFVKGSTVDVNKVEDDEHTDMYNQPERKDYD